VNEIKDGVLWVFSRNEEPMETRVFFVRNAVAAELLPMVQQSLGQLPDTLNRQNSSVSAPQPEAGSEGMSVAGVVTGGISALAGGNTQLAAPSAAAPAAATAGSSRGNVYLDDRSNSLIVTAPMSKLNEISRLIEIYDSRNTARYEERVFKLMHIDKKTLEDAIKMIIPSFDPSKQMFEVQRSAQTSTQGAGGAQRR